MSITINGSQLFGGTNAVRGTRPPPPPGGGPGGGPSPLDSVTDVLGMSKDDITSALEQGKSLSDLADSKGVSHDDLISALKAGMPTQLASSTDADKIAEEIAAQTGVQSVDGAQGVSGAAGTAGVGGVGGAGGFRGPGGHGAAARVGALDGSVSGVLGGTLSTTQQRTLDELSSLLDTDAQSIMSQLRSGSSLADLVKAKGLDSGTLAGVIEDGLLVDART
jgi:lambda repressor-like predicted transcriptional regulator